MPPLRLLLATREKLLYAFSVCLWALPLRMSKDGCRCSLFALDLGQVRWDLDGMTASNDAESGYLGTKSLLARNKSVTAILAGSDPTAPRSL